MFESLVTALSARTLDGLEGCLDPAVEVVIEAVPGIAVSANDHLWRRVRLHGQDEVFEYLRGLYRLLPAIDVTFIPETNPLVVDISGVDAAGMPFRATAEVDVHAGSRGISGIRATVKAVEVGPQLLRGEDPGRYLRAFLAAGRQAMTLSGGSTSASARMSAA
jgi:hypothetical protein